MTEQLQPEMSYRHGPLASKWVAVLAGLCFAVPGLWGLVVSVPQFDKFTTQTWTEVYDYPATVRSGTSRLRIVQLSDTQHAVIRDGFEPGQEALFCMALFSLGTGIAAARFLESVGRRYLSLLLALLWHGLGIATGVLFWKLAPRPLTTFAPILTIVVFEWLGLFPLALGFSNECCRGRLRSAIWSLWAGTIPGALVGGLVGIAVDYVRFGILHQQAQDGLAVPGWLIGPLAGGVVTAIGFATWDWRRARVSSPSADSPIERN